MAKGGLGRRGMSPLIATVLLMAFAVALGGMIMNWSIDRQSHNQCDEIKVSVAKFCQREGKIALSLRNDEKSVALQRIQINVIENSIEKTLKIRDSQLEPGKSLGEILIPETVGASSEVSIIGVVGPEANPILCSTPIQTAAPLPNC